MFSYHNQNREILILQSKVALVCNRNEIKYDKWECHSDYVTQEEWCAANPNKIMLGLTCNDYKPSGVACNLDGVPKYHKSNFKLKCPSGWTTVADADKDKLEKD